MIHDCPKCDTGELDYDIDPTPWDEPTCFVCGDCGARFEIDADADYNGDHYVDTSGPGEEIAPQRSHEGGETRP